MFKNWTQSCNGLLLLFVDFFCPTWSLSLCRVGSGRGSLLDGQMNPPSCLLITCLPSRRPGWHRPPWRWHFDFQVLEFQLQFHWTNMTSCLWKICSSNYAFWNSSGCLFFWCRFYCPPLSDILQATLCLDQILPFLTMGTFVSLRHGVLPPVVWQSAKHEAST